MDSSYSYTPKIAPRGVFALDLGEYLRQLGNLIGEVNVANGWDTSRDMVTHSNLYDPRWHVAHRVAELGLISTEVSEAIEEVRAGRRMDEQYYSLDKKPISYADRDGAIRLGLHPKPEGVPSELADVIIRVLDIADAYGIDIGAAVVEKLNHNATRGLRHGGKTL